MNKTNSASNIDPITVDRDGLQALLGCGYKSAHEIAERAGAIIKIGRRVLYHVPKIKRYMDKLTLQEDE